MTETLSVRIPEEDIAEIKKLSKLEKRTNSTVLRDILDLGIKEKKLEIAIKKFVANEITIAAAAELANLPLTVFMDILSERKISFHYTVNDLTEDFEGLI